MTNVAKQTVPMPELLALHMQAHTIDAGSAERNCGSGEAFARAGMLLLRLVHRHLIVGSVVLVGLTSMFHGLSALISNVSNPGRGIYNLCWD